MLIALQAIGKLSKLQNIVLYGGPNPNQLIHSLLHFFLNIFRNINEDYSKDFYKDLLSEFSDRVTELGRSTILRNRIITQAISDFASFLNGKINSVTPLTISDHNEIIVRFEVMLRAINS